MPDSYFPFLLPDGCSAEYWHVQCVEYANQDDPMKGLRDVPPWFDFRQGRFFSIRHQNLLSITNFGGGGGTLAKNWQLTLHFGVFEMRSTVFPLCLHGQIRYFLVTVHVFLRKPYGVLQFRQPFPVTALPHAKHKRSNICWECLSVCTVKGVASA